MSLTVPRRSTYDAGVDAALWPDIAALPPGGLRAKIGRSLFERLAAKLDLRILLPTGRNIGGGGPAAPEMRLERPGALYRRLGHGGLIGFGEAYMAGDWTAEDLPLVLTVFCRRMATLVPPPLQRLRDVAVHRHPHSEKGTAENARRNISRHYDLSNDLFTLFLDETMTYSAAIFPTDVADRPHADEAQLAAAQTRKIDRLLDLAGVGPGTRLLETGTGWGGLAIAAARRGADVHTVTLSVNQCEEARRRAGQACVADRVRVELCDYRDIRPTAAGGYDAIVSAEMLEGVGHEFWPDYFATLDRLLAPGGRVAIQTITMRHDDMLATRAKDTWIHRYIFPGGLIPSVPAIQAACRRTCLRVQQVGSYGPHYAATLRLWRERFDRHADEVAALGFDRAFQRTWHLYLAYCEAGFSANYLDLEHLLLDRAP